MTGPKPAKAAQSPFEVWLAIPNKARAPRMDYPPLRVVRFSGTALTEGIEEHVRQGHLEEIEERLGKLGEELDRILASLVLIHGQP